ncbi:hypothetical protein [Rhizorhabdus wittichii]|uniref:hypothetical protein n=1 Tax=Rhizorhabdus wittichii TaxID=160791 RepID=UPI00035C4B99|nr:hypothetical protein [Rhizorhabdus wittichii]
MPHQPNFPVASRRYKRLTDQERREAIDRYELGQDTIEGLAQHLDVHRNTIGSLLRRYGAIKGCRAQETVAELQTELDAKMRRHAQQQCLDDIRRLDRFIARTDALDDFMKALMAAEGNDELAAFGRRIGLGH